MLGVVAATMDYTIDEAIRQLNRMHNWFLTLVPRFAGKILTSAGFTGFLAALAGAMVHYLSPLAAGSGIAEAKFILGGDIHQEPARLLPPRMVLAKVLGLTLAAGGNMVVGREGPFVHTSFGLAQMMLTNIPYFAHLNANGTLKRQVFAAACAVGVSSTFTSPIGGVLFSIEVTSTYFLASSYWKGFLCAICGAVVVRLIILARFDAETAESPFFDTDLSGDDFHYAELPLFALLGVFAGLAGTAYVQFDALVRRVLKRMQSASAKDPKKQENLVRGKAIGAVEPGPVPMLSDPETARCGGCVVPKFHPVVLVTIVGATTAIIYFLTGDFNQQNLFSIVDDLVSTEPLGDDWKLYGAEDVTIGYVLLVFLISRTILQTVTTNLKIPCGNFIPCFTMGCAFGRIFAIALDSVFPQYDFSPAGYALVCGAAFTASVTHTISTAVIALEFTGALEYQIPIFVCVMASYAVSLYLGTSLYDMKMRDKNMQHLPALTADQTFQLNARDVMKTDLVVLSRKTSLARVIQRLKDVHFSAYPVVDHQANMVFLGCVSRRALIRFLYLHALKNDIEKELVKDLPKDYTPKVVEELEMSFGKQRADRGRDSNIFQSFFGGFKRQRHHHHHHRHRHHRGGRHRNGAGEHHQTHQTLNPSSLSRGSVRAAGETPHSRFTSAQTSLTKPRSTLVSTCALDEAVSIPSGSRWIVSGAV
mmetsp:Transcript_27326/g.86300  ORF Transcript_27326/g.86300 Transcript_27326/m.86300 type:complete len:704 (-) Transcript_27326:1632-3743(-)